ERSRVRYAVLEKVLVQRPEDLETIAGMLDKASTRAWVNCSRRLNDFYAGLRGLLDGGGPLRMSVQGGAWDPGCNAIHFIDLFAFLTGAPLTAVDTTGLDRRWYPSKRAGFREIAGTLVAHFGGSGRLELHAQTESAAPTLLALQGR